jgi:uncharacterized protein (TIGR02001 family)
MKMRFISAISVAVIAPANSFAADVPDTAMFGSVALTTDYVDRGISQSDGHAAVQGEIGWQHASGLFVGVWASSVDFNDNSEASVETNYILGIERSFRTITAQTEVSYVDYPGAMAALNYDLVELAARADYHLDRDVLTAEVIFAPDNTGNSGRAVYTACGLTHHLTDRLAVRAQVGRQWFEDEALTGPDYNDWRLQAEWEVRLVSVLIAYAESDAGAACADLCDARAILAVRADF